MGEELPSWLDTSFFTRIIQKGNDLKDKSITITKMSVAKAVAAGNNYMSHLYRVRVEYKTKDGDLFVEPLIVKIPISKGMVSEVKDLNEGEPRMYNEILPRFKSITGNDFGPKPFHCSTACMIMRDLKEDGFVMCDKLKQLDFLHCNHVVKVLAKYHAASVACHSQDPILIEAIGKEKFHREDSNFFKEVKAWQENCFRTVCDVLNELNQCKDFVSFLSNKIDHLVDSAVTICKRKESGLNVLNHGDLWVNNMLFKHSTSGVITDFKFIDFQVPRYASPVIDLLYFIWTSADEEVREFKLNDLFDSYVQTLNSALTELGCKDRLSQEELREDLRSFSDWAVITVCCLLPLMVCDEEYVVNFEDINMAEIKDDKSFGRMYKSKHYRDLLTKTANQLHAWILSL